MRHRSNLFQNRLALKANMKAVSTEEDSCWSPSTLTCLKGGLVHGAPAHEDPRMVLFFVATPKQASEKYASNSQFHTWSAIQDVLMKEDTNLSDPQKIENLKDVHMRVMIDWLPELCDKNGLVKSSMPGSVQDSMALFKETIASKGWSNQMGLTGTRKTNRR